MLPEEFKVIAVKEDEKSRLEQIKYLNLEELQTLFNYLKQNNRFYYMACLFLFETACRISEALNAKFMDVDNIQNSIKLVNRKNKKNTLKVLPISDKLKSLFFEHQLNDHMQKSDYILAKKTGEPSVTRQALDKYLKKVFFELFGKEYADRAHPHTFRHSRAIQLLNQGVDLRKVQMLLGHTNIIHTLVYTKFANVDFMKTIQENNDQLNL
jgi:site-specific recombinase XerD